MGVHSREAVTLRVPHTKDYGTGGERDTGVADRTVKSSCSEGDVTGGPSCRSPRVQGLDTSRDKSSEMCPLLDKYLAFLFPEFLSKTPTPFTEPTRATRPHRHFHNPCSYQTRPVSDTQDETEQGLCGVRGVHVCVYACGLCVFGVWTRSHALK